MRYMPIIAGFATFLSFFACNAFSQELEVGQIWKYNCRSNETDSTMTIVQIDKDVIHVSVSGLKIKDPDAEDGISKSIRHLPLSPKSFNSSKTALVGFTKTLPEFEEGLSDWYKAKAKGEASAISLPLIDVIRQVEIMINQ